MRTYHTTEALARPRARSVAPVPVARPRRQGQVIRLCVHRSALPPYLPEEGHGRRKLWSCVRIARRTRGHGRMELRRPERRRGQQRVCADVCARSEPRGESECTNGSRRSAWGSRGILPFMGILIANLERVGVDPAMIPSGLCQRIVLSASGGQPDEVVQAGRHGRTDSTARRRAWLFVVELVEPELRA
jgi:hypothetical protein